MAIWSGNADSVQLFKMQKIKNAEIQDLNL